MSTGSPVPLPEVAPEVLAEAVDGLPSRLRTRLDDMVVLVPGWPSTVDADGTVTLTVDSQTTVRLAAEVRSASDAVCGCLLAPRCLHRTAVLASAPVLAVSIAPADHAIVEAASSDPAPSELVPPDPGLADGFSDQQRLAAAALWAAAVPVLDTGLPGAGAVVQAELLRAVHRARAVGLHRAAAAAIRVVESLRSGRTDQSRFRLEELTDDLRDLLSVCHLIAAERGPAAPLRGTARRDYEDVGSLRLWGVLTEPVLTTSGYAGAATILCDADSRLWTISDARPGGLAEAQRAVEGGITLGDARLSHQQAARSGLVVAEARAAATGRLSGSARTRAVRADGAAWSQLPLAGLFEDPLGQLARYHHALELPVSQRRSGHDLLFLTGTLRTVHGGLAIDAAGLGPVAVGPRFAEAKLPAVDNLRQLVRAAAGRPARLVGRIAGPRSVQALALAADWLPGHHVDLVIDRLTRSELPGADEDGPLTMPAPVGAPAALQLLVHRVQRTVSGGRAATRTAASGDAQRLTAAHLPTAAALLVALRDTADRRTRDTFGRLDPLDHDRLARAWLALASYAITVDRDLSAAAWQPAS